ncbi:hypothetical protein LSTR_LSTR006793 [Laodelphax striatellus]|uniref:Uncharacterized protein n=1 Tax=Laodelphax striatellus TaxID=195883 RepID=A0A482WS51_LAOST|nr:hypothetical protein LSTR_LSTR006793 [Laodelphax striatellus]
MGYKRWVSDMRKHVASKQQVGFSGVRACACLKEQETSRGKVARLFDLSVQSPQLPASLVMSLSSLLLSAPLVLAALSTAWPHSANALDLSRLYGHINAKRNTLVELMDLTTLSQNIRGIGLERMYCTTLTD